MSLKVSQRRHCKLGTSGTWTMSNRREKLVFVLLMSCYVVQAALPLPPPPAPDPPVFVGGALAHRCAPLWTDEKLILTSASQHMSKGKDKTIQFGGDK